MKIAPVLQALMADLWAKARMPPPTQTKAGDAKVLRLAEAELRGLLTVARLLRTEHVCADPSYGKDCVCCRALARLKKASEP